MHELFNQHELRKLRLQADLQRVVSAFRNVRICSGDRRPWQVAHELQNIVLHYGKHYNNVDEVGKS